MKSFIKNVSLSFSLLMIITTSCEKDKIDIITINDKNFLNALIKDGIDLNGDNQISLQEALEIKYLELDNENISDLTGLDKFTRLQRLSCKNNQLTQLNVSNHNQLVYLDFSSNKITSIDLSNNVALCYLDCSSNQLSSIDISNCIFFRTPSGNLTPIIEYTILISDMPSLQTVCVFELPFPSERVIINTEGSPNVFYTDDCN